MDKGAIKINTEVPFNPEEDKIRDQLRLIQADSSNLSVLDEKTIALIEANNKTK